MPERYRAQHEQLRREYGRAAKSRNMGSGASLKLLRGDGQEVPVDISLQPWASPHGRLVLAAVRDVTLRKQREDALRASEERFALAVRGSTDGIWDWNVLTDEVYYSTRFKELLGCADHEMENVFASFESRLLPEDVARVHDGSRTILNNTNPTTSNTVCARNRVNTAGFGARSSRVGRRRSPVADGRVDLGHHGAEALPAAVRTGCPRVARGAIDRGRRGRSGW